MENLTRVAELAYTKSFAVPNPGYDLLFATGKFPAGPWDFERASYNRVHTQPSLEGDIHIWTHRKPTLSNEVSQNSVVKHLEVVDYWLRQSGVEIFVALLNP